MHDTGVHSGSLPAMLFRYAEAEMDTINRFEQELSVWTPRLPCVALAAWTTYDILSGASALMPVRPVCEPASNAVYYPARN